jgi:uncharacterized protein (DUF58 family)
MRALAPTGRSAAALAAIAVSALFLPVWLVAVAALALIVAALVDAWSVRRAPAVERSVPTLISLGDESPLSVVVQNVDHRRVLLRQPATPELTIAGAQGEGELSARLLARRRGRHELPGVASASLGPLGLARVGHRPGEALTVSVYPDVASARALIARLRRDLAGYAGRASRGPLGLGTDFESIRDYTPDDDIRQLNWRASARMGRPMSNQYRLERDRDVISLIDSGRLMSAPVEDRTMLDAALDAVTVLALAADEFGDRAGAIAFDSRIRAVLKPRHRGGRRVVEALLDLQPTPTDSDFERAFAEVGGSRRALIAVFTDLVDEAAARSLAAAVPILARRHAVVVLSATDPALIQMAAGAASDNRRALAEAVVAHDVLATRARAASLLRSAGATVLEAQARRLGAAALRAYVEAKSRARL